jgi:uncharacterized membrane-anchored protein YjiN (DUF445 family)
MGKEIDNGRFAAFTTADTPAPLKKWLDTELHGCESLEQIAREMWEQVNRMLKKDIDQYLFQLSKNAFFVFKNGKQVVEVKELSNE